jgi:hypothetical protein
VSESCRYDADDVWAERSQQVRRAHLPICSCGRRLGRARGRPGTDSAGPRGVTMPIGLPTT